MLSKKQVDFNAHIDSLECNVIVEDNKPYGFVSFTNLGYGTLSAVKFIAMGYNSFGDEVLVNGKEYFFIILQDLNIQINTRYSDVKIKIPNDDIRRIDIREGQLVYADGTMTTYVGQDLQEYNIELLDNTNEHEAEVLDILHDYEASAICLPTELDIGWVCICGQLNKSSSDKCNKCAKERSATFSLCLPGELEKKIRKKNADRIEDEERKKQEVVEVNKHRKKRNIFFAIGTVVSIAIIALIANAEVMSSRMTFSSVSEMQDYLSGTWNEIGGSNTIVFNGDTATIYWKYAGLDLDARVEYNPNRGYITYISTKYILKKSGYSSVTLVSSETNYTKSSSSTSAPEQIDMPYPYAATTPRTSSTFDKYLDENNVILDNSDVQYNMFNNVDKLFSLVGYAELDDYYNYGFDDDIESSHFCLAVTPVSGSYSDMWYIYCHRSSFYKLFDKVQDDGEIYVQMVCEIPSYRYKKNQQCMAQLEYVVY